MGNWLDTQSQLNVTLSSNIYFYPKCAFNFYINCATVLGKRISLYNDIFIKDLTISLISLEYLSLLHKYMAMCGNFLTKVQAEDA